MAPGTEFARDFCAGIGPLQLGVVLVTLFYNINMEITCLWNGEREGGGWHPIFECNLTFIP